MTVEDKLTSHQLKNWRNVLYGIIGSYALVAPDEEIQKIRDKLQEGLDKDKWIDEAHLN